MTNNTVTADRLREILLVAKNADGEVRASMRFAEGETWPISEVIGCLTDWAETDPSRVIALEALALRTPSEGEGVARSDVQRAYDILCAGNPPHSARESNARRVLRQTLTSPQPEGLGIEVKPLDWDTSRADWHCITVVGQYSVGLIGDRYSAILRYIEDDQDNDKVLVRGVTREAAMAACQADFAQRILSSLHPKE